MERGSAMPPSLSSTFSIPSALASHSHLEQAIIAARRLMEPCRPTVPCMQSRLIESCPVLEVPSMFGSGGPPFLFKMDGEWSRFGFKGRAERAVNCNPLANDTQLTCWLDSYDLIPPSRSLCRPRGSTRLLPGTFISSGPSNNPVFGPSPPGRKVTVLVG